MSSAEGFHFRRGLCNFDFVSFNFLIIVAPVQWYGTPVNQILTLSLNLHIDSFNELAYSGGQLVEVVSLMTLLVFDYVEAVGRLVMLDVVVWFGAGHFVDDNLDVFLQTLA